MWRGWEKREFRKIRELTGIDFSFAWLAAGRKILGMEAFFTVLADLTGACIFISTVKVSSLVFSSL
jgi:hypothetical protein